MSTVLLELDDRIITDKGEVVARHELLVRKALSGEVFTELPALPDKDIDLYNQRTGFENPIRIWEDTGEIEGPDPETFDWTIPKSYMELDIIERCQSCLEERNLLSDEYVERLATELVIMDEKDMFPFVRCLLYVVDTFKKNDVVWGIGRGSSCASLVMYVLGINRIDPVKYNIPMDEFYK